MFLANFLHSVSLTYPNRFVVFWEGGGVVEQFYFSFHNSSSDYVQPGEGSLDPGWNGSEWLVFSLALSLSLSLSLSRTPFYSYTNKGCIVETNQSEVLDTMGMLDSETHRGK